MLNASCKSHNENTELNLQITATVLKSSLGGKTLNYQASMVLD